MDNLRSWLDERHELVTALLIAVPMAILMGDACLTMYRGEEIDYLPWLLVLVLGLTLGFRRRLAGLRVGRGGIAFGEDDEEEEL